MQLESLPDSITEDRELALAFKAGEKGAYQAIHDRYCGRVYGVCRRMLSSPHDAEEAAQETFLRAYQALGRFNGRYQLGAWITRIATNVCLDQLRARSRRPQHEATLELLDLENPSLPHDDGPEEIVLRNAEGRRVRKVLASLPPMHRAAIVLRDFEGLTYEEVAIALGITECQVKALIHRARQGFKRSWISAGLAALVPGRMLQKLRGVEVIGKEPVASQAISSTIQAAPACTSALQQCGQYVAEKLAPVLTVALVGAATVGPTAGVASQPLGTQIKKDVSKVSTLLGIDRRQPAPTRKVPERQRPVVAAEPRPEPQSTTQSPQPDPTAEPQPAPSEAPPQEGNSPGHEPNDSQTPEPMPFRVAVGFERGSSIPKLQPKTHESAVTCAPLRIDQRIETMISDGTAAYPATIELHGNAEGVSVFTTIHKDGYEVTYPASAYVHLLERTGNNIHISYEGAYGYDSDAEDAGLPHSDTLWVNLRLDCAASSVIDEALTFGVSPPE